MTGPGSPCQLVAEPGRREYGQTFMETARLSLSSVNGPRPPPWNCPLFLRPIGDWSLSRAPRICSPSILGPPLFSLGSCSHFLIGPASFICREILFTLQSLGWLVTSSEKPSLSVIAPAPRRARRLPPPWESCLRAVSRVLPPAPHLPQRKCPSVTERTKRQLAWLDHLRTAWGWVSRW